MCHSHSFLLRSLKKRPHSANTCVGTQGLGWAKGHAKQAYELFREGALKARAPTVKAAQPRPSQKMASAMFSSLAASLPLSSSSSPALRRSSTANVSPLIGTT